MIHQVCETSTAGFLVPTSFHGDWLLLHHYVSISDSKLFVCNVADATAKATNLLRVAPTALDGVEVGISVAGAVHGLGAGEFGVFFASDEGGNFKSLR